MVYCKACPHLTSDDSDGLILSCELTSQWCYVDDLPFTVMSRCPRKKEEAK